MRPRGDVFRQCGCGLSFVVFCFLVVFVSADNSEIIRPDLRNNDCHAQAETCTEGTEGGPSVLAPVSTS